MLDRAAPGPQTEVVDHKRPALMPTEELIEQDTKTYPCPICGRVFLVRGNMLSHLEEPGAHVVCAIDGCDAQFGTMADLANHRRCLSCGKAPEPADMWTNRDLCRCGGRLTCLTILGRAERGDGSNGGQHSLEP